MEKTGKAYGFFECKDSKEEIESQMPSIRDAFKTQCQEPCAKAQGVLGFLSTFKNAFIFCELKQAGYTKSIFDVSIRVFTKRSKRIAKRQESGF